MGKTRDKGGATKTLICRIERCLGCRSCEMACALVHSKSQDLHQAVLETPLPRKRVTVESAGDRGLALQCRHCENAPCILVCPTEAMHRTGERGPVLIDENRCIGCKLCLVVCPFGVIEVAPDGKAVIKCDLCAERTAAGLEPACVAACPTHALKFVDIDQYTREKRKAAAARIREEVEADKGSRT
jgi:carbon-monoxide dehydrogenase iron sulfur subunit